jgi:hypothetical protein
LLFLFSDGEALTDSAVAGAQWAKGKNMCIFTIGFGSADGSTIPIPAPKTGKAEFFRDRSGQIIKAVLDKKTLNEIATTTDGHYVHSSAAGLISVQKISLPVSRCSESLPKATPTPKKCTRSATSHFYHWDSSFYSSKCSSVLIKNPRNTRYPFTIGFR